MKLTDYIHFNHGGSQTAFANANGMTKQEVNRRVKQGNWYIYDSMLLQAKKENIK